MKYYRIGIFTFIVLLSTTAYSADIAFKGFASIVGGMTFDDPDPNTKVERLSNIYRYDYNKEFSFSEESMFALQANADLGDGLSATVLLYQRAKEDYNSEAYNAYIGYQATSNLRINVGRIPWPLFQYTDFIDVAYTYPWISPPAGVYDLTQANYIDGITAIYFTSLSSWDATFQLHSNLKNTNGLKANFSNDWISFNAVYVVNDDNTARGVPPYEGAAASLEAAGYPQQAEDLLSDTDKGTFMSVGFNADYKGWLAIAEYAQVEFEPSWYSDFQGYYLMLGKRVGDVTFHVTYDVQKETPQLESMNGVPSTQLVDFFGQQAPISLIESALRGRAQDYTNWIYGIRYDFHPSAALKFEYIQNTTDDGDTETFGGIKKFDQDLARIAIDLLF